MLISNAEYASFFEDIINSISDDIYAAIGAVLAGCALVLVLVLLGYIFRSVSLYSIAKRRGIANPGFAWVPVAWNWTLGSIADRHDARDGRNYRWRHLLLWTALIAFAAGLVVTGSNVEFAADAIEDVFEGDALNQAGVFEEIGTMLLTMFIGYAFIGIVTVIKTVCECISYFKLFESCRKRPVLLLILGCIIPFAMPIILLCCRKYDYGVKAGSDQPALPENEAEGL